MVIHNAGSQVYPLLSTNMGVSHLHGLIVASLRINQIYIKIDKIRLFGVRDAILQVGQSRMSAV